MQAHTHKLKLKHYRGEGAPRKVPSSLMHSKGKKENVIDSSEKENKDTFAEKLSRGRWLWLVLILLEPVARAGRAPEHCSLPTKDQHILLLA